jgi:hypothetical protein
MLLWVATERALYGAFRHNARGAFTIVLGYCVAVGVIGHRDNGVTSLGPIAEL